MVYSSTMGRLWLACVVMLVAAWTARADLPIHCLNTQVVGEWVFELGANTHGPGLRCGHKVPDTNADHFTKEGFNLEVVGKIKLNITDPNIATDDKGHKGTWTMVYDEGFEVIINDQIFFAFSKYVPKTPESLSKDDVKDYTSICTETLVGWFHNLDNTKWGCYHGKRVGGAATGKSSRFREQNAQLAPPSYPDEGNDHIVSPIAPPPPRFHKGDTAELNALWEPDYAFIELVNGDENALWTAGVHKGFLGNRMDQMLKLLGAQKNKAAISSTNSHYSHHHHQRPRHRRRGREHKHHHSEHPGHLPRHFDWRHKDGKNYDSPVKNQGNCGSCFAMASISVGEARIRILSDLKHKPLLSTQAVVSCSMYNQGCEGGYPYLVGKHAMDFGLVPQACMPYTGTDEECTFQHGDGCPHGHPKFMATNYSYIGGYYGNCNEQAMMEEIFNHGPIMVAFDAPSSLFYYNGGVYTGASPPHEGPHLQYLHPWEKTNHAVVAVGWGETDSGVKYWIIKNTWGKDWGEHGYFRIRRGTDECGIESMAVTMQIELPDSL